MEARGIEEGSGLRVLTIGHSNHPFEHFLALLRKHSVDVVVDARSYPYSDYAPQYDREPLKRALGDAGVRYVDLGSQIGGRPKDEDFYDSKGHVLYEKVAGTPAFLEGLARLKNGIQNYNVAILCSEENPGICHRKLLVGRVLAKQGFGVEHIRGDGRLEADDQDSITQSGKSMSLFEVRPWKSIPSVLRKRQRSNSSKP